MKINFFGKMFLFLKVCWKSTISFFCDFLTFYLGLKMDVEFWNMFLYQGIHLDKVHVHFHVHVRVRVCIRDRDCLWGCACVCVCVCICVYVRVRFRAYVRVGVCACLCLCSWSCSCSPSCSWTTWYMHRPSSAILG